MGSRMSALLERLRSRRVVSSLMVTATLALGIVIGTLVTQGAKGKEAANSADAAPLQIPAPQQLSSAFSEIAKRLDPSVVNINTESTVRPRGQGRGRRTPEGEDPFQDFFDRFFGGPGGEGGGGEGARERSLGSGVIVDPRGYILTNEHVVSRADRIRVQLKDDPPGVQHTAKVIGSDRETDLAVIKIDTNKTLPVAKMGNSDSLEVGDWVLAIGSPFGLNSSVTAGIISAKGRNIVPQRQFQSMIQTDAAINPGNSGGPLVNMRGEVVGINTAIFTQSFGYQGVGFAMPSNTAAQVYNQLIGPDHRVTRGSIGVEFNAQPSPAIARVYGVNSGVTVANVREAGPADQAGIKVGDTITAVNGKNVKTGDELVNEISAIKPGNKATLTYVRNGKEAKASVTVADRAKLYADRLGDDDETAANTSETESKLGMAVRSMTPELAERLGIPAGKGVVVQDVRPGSFADDIGLQRGFIILEVNRQPVNSEEDFRRIQTQLKSGQDVVFLVQQGRGRNSGTIFLGGTLP
jgi:serine protease Do